jgi:hypothetical protein
VPESRKLPLVLDEIRRVLKDNGSLFMTAPITFFDEPLKPSLGAFIRYTSVEVFPELGAVEGGYVSKMLEEFFPHTCAVEAFPEYAVFRATKRIEKESEQSISIEGISEQGINVPT